MYFLYGDLEMANMIANNYPDFEIYNLTSLGSRFRNANILPPNNLGAISEYDFDVKYAEYIMKNDNVFCNFLDIIYNIYYGKNVYIIINFEDWSVNLIDSILKLIQQRYGINGTLVNDIEDFNNIKDIGFDPYYGISNFDTDKQRYIYIKEKYRVIYCINNNINPQQYSLYD